MKPLALAALIGIIFLAACSRSAPEKSVAAAPTADATMDAAPAASGYVGRWTGVEGMFLDVAAGDAPGRFRLTMQYDLDHKQTADARLDGTSLVFSRDSATKTLRPTDGDATGLKYLAGKKDCLTVAEGEGYCRD